MGGVTKIHSHLESTNIFWSSSFVGQIVLFLCSHYENSIRLLSNVELVKENVVTLYRMKWLWRYVRKLAGNSIIMSFFRFLWLCDICVICQLLRMFVIIMILFFVLNKYLLLISFEFVILNSFSFKGLQIIYVSHNTNLDSSLNKSKI